MLGLILCGYLIITPNGNTAGTYNYGEALQKAIYFYECQQSGVLPEWNRASQWRGDSALNDYVTGGWYDAGDHVKFGLPMAYTASMLGWAMFEYGDALTAAEQDVHLANNLRFVLDYFVKCDRGSEMVYQIGNGNLDHSWWGPVEVIEQKMERPYYTARASCVTAGTAAALAIGAKLFDDSTYLSHAQSLFELADTTRSDADYTAASGFYNSWSGFWDELLWAAVWLYIATGDEDYLAKAESYVAYLGKEGQSADIAYKWAHCWDDVHEGGLLLLARLTGKTEYHNAMQQHLDWWCEGANGFTPGGLAWLDTWGSLRYATTTSFLAFVYGDLMTDTALKTKYHAFAERQVNYVLGDNPRNSSYVIGYGNNSPLHPHHRTSHGSWADSQNIPVNHRHILYGALVGGPNQSDGYTDAISDYVCNEVATDYNAGFVGALAKMYSLYGGESLSNFPPLETVEDEFFIEASVNASGANHTEIRAFCNNRSGWPARVVRNLSFNYYMDLSEVFAAGYEVSDLTVSKNYFEFPVTISPIIQYRGDIYYIKVSFEDGSGIYPGGQSQYAGEVQFRISAPSGTSFWDPTNDFSFAGLTNSVALTRYIPVYDGATLLFGTEPGGSVPEPTPTPPEPTSTPSDPTPTPEPTTTPPTEPGTIAVQMFNSNTAATSNMIYSVFRVENTGSSPLNLADLKLRYYYTVDGDQSQNYWCDYASVGSGNVTGTFVKLGAAVTGADYYLEIGFSDAAGTLLPGNSVEWQIRLAKADWSNYIQTDDYSFNATATTFVAWEKVAGYLDGTLQWGSALNEF